MVVPGHGVISVFLLSFCHGDDVCSISGELSAQEEVHEEDLANHVDKIEKIAQNEDAGVPFVQFHRLLDIFDENFNLRFPLFNIQGAASEATCNFLQATTLICFP